MDSDTNLREEWNRRGAQYAQEVNQMVAFAEKHGWENWQGKEPEDERSHLASPILNKLRAANREQSIDEFREAYPPSHAPFVELLNEKAQSIEQLHWIEEEKIVFLTGTAYQQRQAYVLNGTDLLELDDRIVAIGKSPRNGIFAVATGERIVTTRGWQGEAIKSFKRESSNGLGITQLLPFNDGQRLLIVTSEGIYLAADQEVLIHPVPDPDDDEWTPDIDMENAALSNDNAFIIVGDQASDHRILTADGHQVGSVGPQSSYPHFCLFSKDDQQLITNSCHFYNGVTVGVASDQLAGLHIEAYEESSLYQVVDEEMRVYTGVAAGGYYILGDAYGYIRALDQSGNQLWRYFLGSTISGITISEDKKTLWVGSYSGMLHKLKLGAGHRDNHTIGNGNHYEAFRLLFWKNEEMVLRW